MTSDAVHPTEQCTAKQRVAMVGNIRKGKIDLAEGAGGKNGPTVADVKWGEKFPLEA